MDTKNYAQVLIDGKIYTLTGSEGEAYLQKTASYVNEKLAAMRKLPGFGKQNSDYQMAMLGLNVADDYFKAREEADRAVSERDAMEKETYSLKHELVGTQMKLEAVLKDLEERQRELEQLQKKAASLEAEREKLRAEAEKRQAEAERLRAEAEKRQTEAEQLRADREKKPAEPERKPAGTEAGFGQASRRLRRSMRRWCARPWRPRRRPAAGRMGADRLASGRLRRGAFSRSVSGSAGTVKRGCLKALPEASFCALAKKEIGMREKKKVELLAPAGSLDCLRAAVAAGADAAYMGGPRFGARAYAENADEEGLLGAIDFVHLHGRRLYMTVNTLFKEEELAELTDYMTPFYRQGLDGVIVQDLGPCV